MGTLRKSAVQHVAGLNSLRNSVAQDMNSENNIPEARMFIMLSIAWFHSMSYLPLQSYGHGEMRLPITKVVASYIDSVFLPLQRFLW